jgi:hypothetical protein
MFQLRLHGTDRNGNGFSPSVIQAVWEKATPVIGYDPTISRRDSCGAMIKRSDYGNTNSRYGWEVDHIKPVSKDGKDDLQNLQPLQWENNRYESDNFPQWYCKLRA